MANIWALYFQKLAIVSRPIYWVGVSRTNTSIRICCWNIG